MLELGLKNLGFINQLYQKLAQEKIGDIYKSPAKGSSALRLLEKDVKMTSLAAGYSAAGDAQRIATL